MTTSTEVARDIVDLMVWLNTLRANNEKGALLARAIVALQEQPEALTAARRAGAEEMRTRCAALVEQNQQTTSNTVEDSYHHLTPRKPGNSDGLVYATAIRALPIGDE